jgi:hypothetical protein
MTTISYYIQGLGDKDMDSFIRHMTRKDYHVGYTVDYIYADLCQNGVNEMFAYLSKKGYIEHDTGQNFRFFSDKPNENSPKILTFKQQ